MISRHRPNDEITVLSADVARIDAAISMSFKEEARQLLLDQKGRIIIDLAQVEFLDSSGLGTLVAIMKMLDDGRRLELANCGPVVSKVLTLTRMDRVFILHDGLAFPRQTAGTGLADTDSQDAA